MQQEVQPPGVVLRLDSGQRVKAHGPRSQERDVSHDAVQKEVQEAAHGKDQQPCSARVPWFDPAGSPCEEHQREPDGRIVRPVGMMVVLAAVQGIKIKGPTYLTNQTIL